MNSLNLFFIIFFTQFNIYFAQICRQSNNHKNYTCHGFRFNQMTVSRITKLQILRAEIYNCKTTSIPANVLQFPNLQHLTLSCNINTIDENSFSNVNQLVELNLSHNALSTLPNNMFGSLANLQSLNLSNNNIEELTETMFDGLNNLNKLILSNNLISRLNIDTFKKVKILEKLYLNKNKISFLPGVIFNRLNKLIFLDLSFNNIEIMGDIFLQNNNLIHLNLSHNKIRQLPTFAFQTINLEVLDLSYNELEVFYQYKINLETLREFYLRNNKLSLFEVSGLGQKQIPLSILDLRNNRLVFLQNDLIKSTTNLIMLKVEGNPLDCHCLEDIQNLNENLSFDLDNLDDDTPRCVSGTDQGCNIDINKLNSYYEIFRERSR